MNQRQTRRATVGLLAMLIVLTQLVMISTLSVTAYAVDDGSVVEVLTDDGASQGTGEATYDKKNDGNKKPSGGKTEIPEAVGDILNGEDHASKLFGTDNFNPAAVDTSWVQPVVDAVAWLASVACAAFGALTLAKFIIDAICLLWGGFGRLLFQVKLHWLYSDTAAILAGLPVPDTRVLGTIDDAPSTMAGKYVYWVKDSLLTAIIAGSILAGIATGIIPDLINMGVNAIINAFVFVISWVKSL